MVLLSLDLAGLPVAQSSIEWGGVASRATDGNPNTHFLSGRSCTHTGGEGVFNSPWWRVTLAAPRTIVAVSVTNRGDCCGERLDGFSVLVDGVTCAAGVRIMAGKTKLVPCVATGREIQIMLPGRPGESRVLTLCEVGVVVAIPAR